MAHSVCLGRASFEAWYKPGGSTEEIVGDGQDVAAGELGSQAQAALSCKKCGSNRLHRVFREGFMQEHIYPFFGYFPWKCNMCGTQMMCQKRQKRHRRGSVKEYTESERQ